MLYKIVHTYNLLLFSDKPSDVGVHINTTLAIASSKKMKLLIIFNSLLSLICVIVSFSIAFYCLNELISMKKQLDVFKDQFLNVKDGKLNQSKAAPVVSLLQPSDFKAREPRMEVPSFKDELSPNTKRYYVEDLGEDMLLLDSSKKYASHDKSPSYDLSIFQKGNKFYL